MKGNDNTRAPLLPEQWLKPRGKVLISDYCKRAGSPSEEFAKYIKRRGYDLHDVEAYGQILRDAGFDEFIAEDRTEQYICFFPTISLLSIPWIFKFIWFEEDYNDIVGGWKSKLVGVQLGSIGGVYLLPRRNDQLV